MEPAPPQITPVLSSKETLQNLLSKEQMQEIYNSRDETQFIRIRKVIRKRARKIKYRLRIVRKGSGKSKKRKVSANDAGNQRKHDGEIINYNNQHLTSYSANTREML